MKVLHVGKYYPQYAGGVERFLGDLLPALARRKVQSLALVHHGKAKWEIATPSQDFPGVVRVPTYGQWLYAPISPHFPLALAQWLAAFEPDVLHLHCPNVDALWVLALRRALRLPWVIHWHADVVPCPGEHLLKAAYLFYRRFEGALLQKARWVVATSLPYLESSNPLRPFKNKCRVVPLGVDPDRLPEPSPEARLAAEKLWETPHALRLLVIGRLTPYKGHETLLAAVARVPQIKLLIVGTGPLEESLRRSIARLGLTGRAHLLGLRPDGEVHALLDTCHALCLPSIERTEAFGLVLLEGMRFGKALVASRVEGSGMAWVVEDGREGRLVRPGNVEAWAQTLLEINADRAGLERMGRMAREKFHRIFHIERAAEKIVALYEEAIQHGPA